MFCPGHATTARRSIRWVETMRGILVDVAGNDRRRTAMRKFVGAVVVAAALSFAGGVSLAPASAATLVARALSGHESQLAADRPTDVSAQRRFHRNRPHFRRAHFRRVHFHRAHFRPHFYGYRPFYRRYYGYGYGWPYSRPAFYRPWGPVWRRPWGPTFYRPWGPGFHRPWGPGFYRPWGFYPPGFGFGFGW